MAGCIAADDACIGLVSNKGQTTFGLRMAEIDISTPAKLASGLVMGLAIPIMHYVGMAAVRLYGRVLDGRAKADETTDLVARTLDAPDRDAYLNAVYDAPLVPATLPRCELLFQREPTRTLPPRTATRPFSLRPAWGTATRIRKARKPRRWRR